MKLKPSILGLALAGAAALCANAPAEAQQRPIEPYYFTPKITYSHTMMDSMDTRGSVTGDFWMHENEGLGRFNGGDKTDNSVGGGAAVGYDFGAYSEYPIRLELEYLNRGNVNGDYKMQQTMNKYTDDGPGGLNQSWNSYNIKSSIQTVMLNAYLDFPTDTAFTPYVGAGLGGAYVDSKLSGVSYGNLSADPGYYVCNGQPCEGLNGSFTGDKGHAGSYNFRPKGQQNSWNFAWQVSAGASYQFTDNLAFDLSYRYSDFGDADFGSKRLYVSGAKSNGDFVDAGTGDPADNTPGTNTEAQLGTMIHKGKIDLSAHEVIFGLRITAF